MESVSVLLKRQFTRDLVHFLDALTLYLQAGYDLAYSWPAALNALDGLNPRLKRILLPELSQDQGISEILYQLGSTYLVSEHRLWFSVLRELYLSGAGLQQGVGAFAGALRGELGRELEAHCRTLPTKINVLMLLFFLPPTLLLLFAPFVMDVLVAFPTP